MSTQFNSSSQTNQSSTFGKSKSTSAMKLSPTSERSPQPKPTKKTTVTLTKTDTSALRQWLSNLPIARKQLILVGASAISILGLVGVGGLVVSSGLKQQLLQQARSENAVVDINYKIKINQMGFGFRGQSDNTAVIEASVEAAKGRQIEPELQSQVQKILQNEIKARKIEYATLVGKDLRILIGSNANRQGETFNPNGLVAEVFREPKQIKASAVVSGAELKKEAPPLPEGFTYQDSLIRYTVTPVFDPATKQPVAALVSGDIVNGKLPIVENTLKAFGGGYSAIYFRQPDGKFTLANALHQDEGESLESAYKNEPLPDLTLLTKAVENPGKAIAKEIKIEDDLYAVSALAIPNIYKEEATGPVPVQGRGEPVAILVRGTPETATNALLRNSLLTQIGLGIIVLAFNVGLAIIIGRAIARPIEDLQKTTQKFAKGDRSSRAQVGSTDEVGRLSSTFNQLADNIVANESTLLQEATKLELARQETEKLAQKERQRSEVLQQELLQFINSVEAASQGNLTVRADITAGEIGIVADMFNSIVESLRDIVTQVKQAAVQVNGSVSKNENAIRRLSDEAIQQSDRINQTLNSVEVMARTIQQVADNAQAAAEVARSASATAEMGGEDMELTVNSIVQLRDTVTETAKKIKRLGEASQQISKAVTLINQISMQTNLLAVNASIEAARAGEEGQGFAVVAAEVGQLAAQSAVATKEIEQLVDAIQQETNSAIKAMKISTSQVEEGTQLAEKTKQSLGQIVEVSRQIDQLLQSISQATVSQADTSQTVTELMEEIAEISEKTSNSSRNVSSALQETVQIAQELQESVGTFKVL